MRTWTLVLLLMTTVLGGCAGEETPEAAQDSDPAPDGDPDGATPTEKETDGTGDDTTGADNASAENSAPEASLAADVLQGTAPLVVSFTLDATDADGDQLIWSFDADGDGTAEADSANEDLPATVSFTYETVGNHTAVFTVEDGEAGDEASLDISVVDPLAAPRDPETWWLYMRSSCDADGTLEKEEGGPGGGCIHSDSPAGPALGGDSGFMHVFDAIEPSAGFAQGTAVAGQVTFGVYGAVTPVAEFTVRLYADDDLVYEEVRTMEPGPGGEVVVEWGGTLAGDIPVDAVLQLQARLINPSHVGYSTPLGTDPDSMTIG